ncbi:TRAP transporter substrate-binding protein [Ottowia thiooxydans]|uniref:TRAP transporter substrate-binding protein n=1 Tax=Ottowia thiooxydans TaxID=219182 RepID=UPI0003F95368|nr:TRAP transporter substrate-binding protein [Ottowia thiooxydans]
MISRQRFILSAVAATALAVLSTPTLAQVREQNFKIGTTLPDDHPITQGAKKFGELLQAKSAGKMKARVYSSASLGNEMQMQSALQGGVQDFSIATTTTLVGMVKEYSLFDMPYMFRTTAEADAILDGAIGKQLFALLEPKNLIGLTYMEQGFRDTTNSKHPISKWEDFKGLKIRVQPSAFYVDMFNALGANAVPMTINEVYTAMETKAIDGHENSLAAVNSNRFQEVQKYLSLTGHAYNAVALLMSKKTYDKLNPDERKLVSEAAQEAAIYERGVSRALAGSLLEKLKKDGMQVNDVTPAEKQRLAEKLQPVVTKYAGIIGGDWMQRMGSELAKIRTGK